MGLSAEKKRALGELYESWGIDKVRRDLERHYHPSLLSSDVTDFARAWLNAKDAKDRRGYALVRAFKVIFFSLIAGVAAALLAV